MDQPPLITGIEPKTTQDQTHHEERLLFETTLAGLPWGDRYLSLLESGWTWRQAAYIAWVSLPKNQRYPATLDKNTNGEPGLAQILGLSNASKIRKWRLKNKAIDVAARRFMLQDLLPQIPGILQASIDSALNDGYKGKGDREMLLGITGIYAPKNKVGISLEEKRGDDLDNLSDEELVALLDEIERGDDSE